MPVCLNESRVVVLTLIDEDILLVRLHVPEPQADALRPPHARGNQEADDQLVPKAVCRLNEFIHLIGFEIEHTLPSCPLLFRGDRPLAV